MIIKKIPSERWDNPIFMEVFFKKNVDAYNPQTFVHAGNKSLRVPKLSSVDWWCFLLTTRFELISALVASFPELLASRLFPSSSCPVPGFFCQTLTQRPVIASYQGGTYR